MIEKYFRDGIRYKWDAPRPQSQRMDGTIVDNTGVTPLIIYDGLDSHLIDPVPYVSMIGLRMGMSIQHVWLDYNLGRTSRCPIGPYDVLTGFMSGCLITQWTDRGVQYVGHVGTVENQSKVNRSVKGTFARAMTRDAKGFNPAAAWDLTEIQAKICQFRQTPFAKIVALVTTSGRFYSILMLQLQPDLQEPSIQVGKDWCVGGIKRVQPMDRDRLYMELRKYLN